MANVVRSIEEISDAHIQKLSFFRDLWLCTNLFCSLNNKFEFYILPLTSSVFALPFKQGQMVSSNALP